MFRRALDSLGGIYERAQIVAVFGDNTIQELPDRWRPHFGRIAVHHVPPEDFRARSYAAQGDATWTHVPEDCDVAILCDADTMVLRPFDDLLERLLESPGIAGTIAHVPFPQFPGDTPADKWASLGRQLVERDLPLTYEHTFWQPTDPTWMRACPFYVNHGFVLIPRTLVEPLGSTFRRLSPRVESLLRDPYFGGQVALTLAVYAVGIRHQAVDMKYNFPNDVRAEALHAASLSDVRVIHYLRTHHFDRQRIFADHVAFDDFLDLNLSGSDLLFQEHVRRITSGRYPF